MTALPPKAQAEKSCSAVEPSWHWYMTRVRNVIGIESLEQVYSILERYIPSQRLTPMASFFAQEMFARYERDASLESSPRA